MPDASAGVSGLNTPLLLLRKGAGSATRGAVAGVASSGAAAPKPCRAASQISVREQSCQHQEP